MPIMDGFVLIKKNSKWLGPGIEPRTSHSKKVGRWSICEYVDIVLTNAQT